MPSLPIVLIVWVASSLRTQSIRTTSMTGGPSICGLGTWVVSLRAALRPGASKTRSSARVDARRGSGTRVRAWVAGVSSGVVCGSASMAGWRRGLKRRRGRTTGVSMRVSSRPSSFDLISTAYIRLQLCGW